MSTVQAIGALILRILGLYFVVTGLPVLGIYVAMYLGLAHGGWSQDEWPGLIHQLCILAFALLSIFLAKPLARLIAPSGEQTGAAPQAINPGELVSMGSFLIGLLILVWRLPALLVQLAQNMLARIQHLDAGEAVTHGPVFDAWTAAQQAIILLIAFWLFFRPASLTGLYRWLRTAGPPVAVAQENPTKETTP